MRSEPSRTFIGSVVCVDLVGYSKRSVAQQSTIKAEFNRILSQVLKPIRPEDRIILDTGDGVAVTFLGDPDQCLSMGLEMRDVLNANGMKLGAEPGEGPTRMGIHLGPLKVALDMNGHPNIVGDGLVVAERVAAFAKPGQLVASRSFHDMVSRLSDEHLAMFKFEGKHTDKNAREHEVYSISDPRRAASAPPPKAVATQVPVPPPRPAAKPPPPAPAPKAAERKPDPAPTQPPQVVTSEGAFVRFLRNRVAVAAAAVALLALIFGEAWLLDQRGARNAPAATAEATAPKVAAAPASVPPPPKVEKPAVAPEPVQNAEAPKVAAKAPEKVEAPKAPPPKEETPGVETRKQEPARIEPPKVEARKPEPPPQRAVVPPARLEPPKAENAPAPGSPMAVAAQARERAAEAGRTVESKPALPPRKIEEPARPSALKPATPPTTSIPAPTAAIPAPTPATPAPPPQEPAPSPAPVVAAATTVTPVTRVPVNFPRAAAQQGIESGTVKARLGISAEGRVTSVRILSSDPPRVFDREAIRALEEWRFNAGAAGRSYDVEIEFRR